MWLAYDIGTTGAKVALVDMRGGVVASAYRAYTTETGADGTAEQRPLDWWEAVVAATRELAPDAVEGIAVTGQMQDVILLDAKGVPTHPAILYSDTRAQSQAAAYVAAVDLDALRSAAGNKQGEGADGLPAKLMWLAANVPDALHRAAHLLTGAADYVVYRMSGVFATDSTTVSATGLLHMASRAPLNAALLPEVVRSHLGKLAQVLPGGAQVGALTADAAVALGLPAETPVHIGPGDAGAASFGAGSSQPGRVYAYLGTSGWVAFSASEVAPFDSGVITLAHPMPGLHLQIAPLLTAGGNLERALSMLNMPDYNTLLARAAPGPVKVLYLPYLSGERSPFVDPLARAAFIGINSQTDAGVLVRALLTGVAYGYRHALDELMATPIDALVMTGGGTRSETWMQIFADVLDVPVLVTADAENVGVRGVVAAARGVTFDVVTDHTYSPGSAHRAFYDRQYAVFKTAYPALKSVFAGLA